MLYKDIQSTAAQIAKRCSAIKTYDWALQIFATLFDRNYFYLEPFATGASLDFHGQLFA